VPAEKLTFTREPYSRINGFACFHQNVHATDRTWFDTLSQEQWSAIVAAQRAGQQHKVDYFLIPTMKRYGMGPNVKVLSIGCGMGFDVLRLRSYGYDAIGCDFGGRTQAWLENGLDANFAFLADAADLPVANETYDVVFLWHVIEHFGCVDGNQIMAANADSIRSRIVESIRSILKPGGLCIVGTPNRMFPLDQYHGHHVYINPEVARWAAAHNVGIHYFWDKRDFLLSKSQLRNLFVRFRGIEWLSLSIGLALSKGITHKERGALLEKYARLIDLAGLSTSFLSPALHLVAQK
jgi:SAM-dependent methyltransferase